MFKKFTNLKKLKIKTKLKKIFKIFYNYFYEILNKIFNHKKIFYFTFKKYIFSFK